MSEVTGTNGITRPGNGRNRSNEIVQVIVLLFVLAAGFAAGKFIEQSHWRALLIREGYAVWKIDPEDGGTANWHLKRVSEVCDEYNKVRKE